MNRVVSQPVCDAFGRHISYLRVSVTDRCNFRCRYCRDSFDSSIRHSDILRYEEIESLIGMAVGLGVRKVRFTGGEPFVRKGFMDFLERIRMRFPEIAFHTTSNGTMPSEYLPRLKELGVRLNISLDSLDRKRFTDITGVDSFEIVWANIQRILELGIPLKINAVAMRGVNDVELPDFLKLAFTLPIELRYIEMMPVGHGMETPLFISASELLERASALYTLDSVQNPNAEQGPARVWRLRDKNGVPSQGLFGIISSVTHNACSVCNRMRLTSSGNLCPCLFDGREYRIRSILRHPKLGLDFVQRVWEKAVLRKPLGAVLLGSAMQNKAPVTQRKMVSIGG